MVTPFWQCQPIPHFGSIYIFDIEAIVCWVPSDEPCHTIYWPKNIWRSSYVSRLAWSFLAHSPCINRKQLLGSLYHVGLPGLLGLHYFSLGCCQFGFSSRLGYFGLKKHWTSIAIYYLSDILIINNNKNYLKFSALSIKLY